MSVPESVGLGGWGLVDSVRYLYALRKRVDNYFQEGKYVSNNTMGCHRSATKFVCQQQNFLSEFLNKNSDDR